jgi:pyruvate/2-oxoglutarate dehydrogenase complex dihydrolipoamide dehydrogenase (E3) component
MYDVLVVGGGPAGVTAALRARELGASAALVEESEFGGTCTNDGCVPTRVLAKTARLMRDARQAKDYGVSSVGEPEIDFAAMLRRVNAVVDEVKRNKGLESHLRHTGVEVYAKAGAASFVDPSTVETEDGTRLSGKKIVIAVGGHPKKLPIPGSEHALSPNDVWSLDTLPRSVFIIGAGATGAQLASVFNDFGARTTLVDILPSVLPLEDEDVSAEMERAFEQAGIEVLTGIDSCESLEKGEADGPVTVEYSTDGTVRRVDVDAVIMATGWAGTIEALGLQRAGIETEKSYIVVDENLRTTAEHVYAVGDVVGKTMLVQHAANQARIAVENAVLGRSTTDESVNAPHGGFTDPEYGGVGKTTADAKEAHDLAVARVPFRALDRALIDGRPEGFFKLLVDRESHHVVGAHVVGEHAVELVEMVASGMSGGAKVEELGNLENAYPTFSAIVGVAARDIVRQLGIFPVSQEWRELVESPRAAEWERSSR